MNNKTIETIIVGCEQVGITEFFEYAKDSKFFAVNDVDLYRFNVKSKKYELLIHNYSQDEYDFVKNLNEDLKR